SARISASRLARGAREPNSSARPEVTRAGRESHEPSARVVRRAVARRPRAGRDSDSCLGNDVLHPGADAAAARGRPGIHHAFRDGRILGRLAGWWLCRAPCRRVDRSVRRASRDAGRLAARRARIVRSGARGRSAVVFGGVGRAGRGDGGLALRSGLRDARPHFRSARAATDHGAHTRRRLCVDRELAGDAGAAGRARLARHLCGLCRAARRDRRPAALAPAAPLHWLALPRGRAEAETRPAGPAGPAPAVFPAKGRAFLLVASAFAAYAFVPSGLSAHLLAVFSRHGIEPATVVVIGALFGPAQVTARVCELAFARNVQPLWIVRLALGVLVLGFVLLALFGFTVAAAAAFAALFGAGNGLVTIARGPVPVALFGAARYGRAVGRLAAA